MIFSPFAVATLSIFVLGNKAEALNLINNEYIKGDSVLNRSPCPAINTVANHGFVNRDGMSVRNTDLAAALTEVFGVDVSFSLGAMEAQKEAGLPVTENGDGTFNIDLFSWYGQFDHEASLLRKDPSAEEPQPQFDQDLFDDLASLSEDGETITKEMLAEHQQNQIKASRTSLPDSFDIPVTGLGQQATVTMLFGNDDNLETASLDFIKSFYDENRIPDGYLPRQERGVPLLLSADDTVSGDVLGFFLGSVEEALAAPLDADGGDMDSMDPTMAPSDSESAAASWGNAANILLVSAAVAWSCLLSFSV